MMNATMMASLAVASVATLHYDPRSIGVVAGLLSGSTTLFWMWAQWTGRLTEPHLEDPGEVTKADTVVPA